MSSAAAPLLEIFSSIQGEGALVGRRQIFIRFHGCNLSCDYCDTNISGPADSCRIELTPGRHDFCEVPNPVGLDMVLSLLERWQEGWPKVHHSISLTGGEPLLFSDALHAWLPRLRQILPVHLETNGVLHSALARIVRDLDHISMDIKLPSSSGESGLWEEHQEFLAIAAAVDTAVKVVVNSATEHWEIARAAESVAAVSAGIPFIIQPVTLGENSMGISPAALIKLQEIVASVLDDVRVIPQTHKFLGLL